MFYSYFHFNFVRRIVNNNNNNNNNNNININNNYDDYYYDDYLNYQDYEENASNTQLQNTFQSQQNLAPNLNRPFASINQNTNPVLPPFFSSVSNQFSQQAANPANVQSTFYPQLTNQFPNRQQLLPSNPNQTFSGYPFRNIGLWVKLSKFRNTGLELSYSMSQINLERFVSVLQLIDWVYVHNYSA